ncbi:MAG: hypothetical protein VX699_10120 [Myxococcota bacterium]|nr:hypothetical protein [Myxococcota bacterium]
MRYCIPPLILLPLLWLVSASCGGEGQISENSPPDYAPSTFSRLPDFRSKASHSEPPPRKVPPRSTPTRVWTAPEGEELNCGNTQIPFTFQPLNQHYTLNNAFWMMWFNKRAASEQREETLRELQSVGFEENHFIDAPDDALTVLVSSNPQGILVAFHTDSNLVDWLANLQFGQVSGAEHDVQGRIHRGITELLNRHWPYIIARITLNQGEENLPIWLTGHGTGGALATLAAARVANLGYPLGPLYTYGAPRIGDSDFATDLQQQTNDQHYRLVNEADLIARLIPSGSSGAEAAEAIFPGQEEEGAQYLQELDYLHGGVMYRMETSDTVTVFPAMQEIEDRVYWTGVEDQGLREMMVTWAQEKRHRNSTYLCRLRTLRRALGEWPESF